MTKPDHTAPARVARYADRLKASGLVRLCVWIPDTPAAKEAVRKLVAKLKGSVDSGGLAERLTPEQLGRLRSLNVEPEADGEAKLKGEK